MVYGGSMKWPILFIVLGCIALNTSAQKATYQQRLDDKYASGLFKSDNAYTLVVMDDPAALSYFTVFQYLQGKIPGLLIYQPTPFATPFVSYRQGRPSLFLDEIRVDAQTLSTISLSDVAIIKVFRPPFSGYFGGANGTIAVYTKNGDEEDL